MFNAALSYSSQPVFGVQQDMTRQAEAFLSFKRLPAVQFGPSPQPERPWLWFGPSASLVGRGVMLAISRGRAMVTHALSTASEDCIKLAAVLNGAIYLQDLHYMLDGCDTHHFVKLGPADGDLAMLQLTSGKRLLENGVNVSVWQSTVVVASGGRTRRLVDVEIQSGALALHLRYGTTQDEERERVLELARQRALVSAWAREQQRVRDGEEGARQWTEGEKRQLLSGGKVPGYDGYYVLSVEQYPELADSPSNIQFLRQNEIGKR